MNANRELSLSALLFDVDGTLADTERDGHRVAFNRAFAEAGLDWDWTPELYGRLLEVTGGKERIRHFLATELPDFRFAGDADAEIASLHKRKTHFYTRKCWARAAIPCVRAWSACCARRATRACGWRSPPRRRPPTWRRC